MIRIIINGITCCVAGTFFLKKSKELLKHDKTWECTVKIVAFTLRGRDKILDGISAIKLTTEDIIVEAEQLNEKKNT